MGYWHTDSGKKFKVNLDQDLIAAMKDAGRFLFVGSKIIRVLMMKTTKHFTKQKRMMERKLGCSVKILKLQQKTDRILPTLSGYVSHWVENKDGQTMGTNIKEWFIFQPKTYPTSYIISRENDVVVTDL